MDGTMTGVTEEFLFLSKCALSNYSSLAESAVKSQLKAFPLLLERAGHSQFPFPWCFIPSWLSGLGNR